MENDFDGLASILGKAILHKIREEHEKQELEQRVQVLTAAVTYLLRERREGSEIVVTDEMGEALNGSGIVLERKDDGFRVREMNADEIRKAQGKDEGGGGTVSDSELRDLLRRQGGLPRGGNA